MNEKIVSPSAFARALMVLTVGALAVSAAYAARTFEQMVTITATVEKIDQKTREITLKGPLGNEETFVVSDEVKRLNEIKKGDEVVVDYYIGIAAELRPPTEEEKAQPFVVTEGEGKAGPKSPPAAGAGRTVRVVATVEGLDRPSQTVTLKGPQGRYITVRVEDPETLLKPRIGDTVIVTAAEALAVSIEKAQPKKKEKAAPAK